MNIPLIHRGKPQEEDRIQTFTETYVGSQISDDYALKFETADDLITMIEHDLRGEVPRQSKKGIVWILEPQNKKMNEAGINEVSNIIRMNVNHITLMSDLNDEIIAIMCSSLHAGLADFLVYNQKKFDIDSKNMYLIHLKIMNLIWAALRKAYKAGDRNFWSRVQKIIKQERDNQQNKNKVI